MNMSNRLKDFLKTLHIRIKNINKKYQKYFLFLIVYFYRTQGNAVFIHFYIIFIKACKLIASLLQ